MGHIENYLQNMNSGFDTTLLRTIQEHRHCPSAVSVFETALLCIIVPRPPHTALFTVLKFREHASRTRFCWSETVSTA